MEADLRRNSNTGSVIGVQDDQVRLQNPFALPSSTLGEYLQDRREVLLQRIASKTPLFFDLHDSALRICNYLLCDGKSPEIISLTVRSVAEVKLLVSPFERRQVSLDELNFSLEGVPDLRLAQHVVVGFQDRGASWLVDPLVSSEPLSLKDFASITRYREEDYGEKELLLPSDLRERIGPFELLGFRRPRLWTQVQIAGQELHKEVARLIDRMKNSLPRGYYPLDPFIMGLVSEERAIRVDCIRFLHALLASDARCELTPRPPTTGHTIAVTEDGPFFNVAERTTVSEVGLNYLLGLFAREQSQGQDLSGYFDPIEFALNFDDIEQFHHAVCIQPYLREYLQGKGWDLADLLMGAMEQEMREKEVSYPFIESVFELLSNHLGGANDRARWEKVKKLYASVAHEAQFVFPRGNNAHQQNSSWPRFLSFFRTDSGSPDS